MKNLFEKTKKERLQQVKLFVLIKLICSIIKFRSFCHLDSKNNIFEIPFEEIYSNPMAEECGNLMLSHYWGLFDFDEELLVLWLSNIKEEMHETIHKLEQFPFNPEFHSIIDSLEFKSVFDIISNEKHIPTFHQNVIGIMLDMNQKHRTFYSSQIGLVHFYEDLTPLKNDELGYEYIFKVRQVEKLNVAYDVKVVFPENQNLSIIMPYNMLKTGILLESCEYYASPNAIFEIELSESLLRCKMIHHTPELYEVILVDEFKFDSNQKMSA